MKLYRIPPILLIAALCGACSGETRHSERAAWLQTTLVEDNLLVIEREPELSAGKFAKMASLPYYYFRGTNAQFYRDLTDADAPFSQTAFGSSAASGVLLMGDPHPENIGTYRSAKGEMNVEFNDFDGARFGPFHFDVRRLGVGFGVAAETMELDTTTRDALIEAAARGYVDEIGRMSRGAEPYRVDPNFPGPILGDLIDGAIKDGDEKEALFEYTRVRDGRRRLFFGAVESPIVEGVIEDELVEVDARERRLVERLVAQYPQTLVEPQPAGAFELKGVGRRLGGGVASYALLRFYALVEGPTDSRDDDWLLELKEIRDPTAIPRLAELPPRQFDTNAQRVVVAQRRMQIDAKNDPLLGWAASDTLSFRVRHRTKYQKGLDVADIEEGLAEADWDIQHVLRFATIAGRLLARSHAIAPRRDGGDALAAIAATLDGREDAFVDETSTFARSYTDRVMSDYALFVDLLDAEGPLLGARRMRATP
ncbi:DUF2252 domain-containing protein [Persicimonas caeni]|uniref:DUF2252 domain-containing protein n=1 Tax=Persicimonas caeni TaxID=2292766 RepID=A0A4Y6PVG4_PERCE|nr:DUF2252 family protein [Persicimonas caeni]QDG52344.1 DUF2252 domain-containing protein [Persicimonas caeni]QED33566.1 DUF2252 domain-containing protein [Persicimonas caeni]